MSTRHSIFGSRTGGIGLIIVLAAGLVACAEEPGQSAEPSSAAPSVVESTAPSATAEPVGQFLFLDVDVVLGPTNLTDEEKPAKSCVQWSRFAHNEQVVWRVKVLDPLTGEAMDDTMVTTLQVVMADQTLDLHYGPHPRDNPLGFFWTTSWVVPEGYPEGVINYTVEATANDGRTGSWEQFEVAAANLTVTADVRPVIAQ
ncbi:MAG: hypothetical protein OEW24_05980 [Chloroflexota bacterium]|nr:hypothetical protein [Chloroflexota bacterium]